MEEINIIRGELIQLAGKKRAENSKRYLKSPYDFYGVINPELRRIAKEYKNMEFYSALNLFDELWNSGNHEEMCLALFILRFYVKKYPYEIWRFLSTRIDKLKTWDHVDELSIHILGAILEMDIRLMPGIKKLSESRNPWFRRTSIVSTCYLIKKNKIELTLRLAEKLVYDDDIYVQKGAGWMLREAGKKDRTTIREFILRHIDMKPHAFSYATEKMLELRKIRKEKIKKEKEEKARKKEEEKEKIKNDKSKQTEI